MADSSVNSLSPNYELPLPYLSTTPGPHSVSSNSSEFSIRHPLSFEVEASEGFFSGPKEPYSSSYAPLIETPWLVDSGLNDILEQRGASFQTLSEGFGSVILDEYSVVLESLPEAQSASEFINKFAGDIDAGVNDETFSFINSFQRREVGSVAVGDVYDIDILGPINGSVMVVDVKPLEFTVQTIKTEAERHPEMGARTFGISENEDGTYTFFTRGVSRPRNLLIGLGSKLFQPASWARMMRGVSDQVNESGGASREGSFAYKHSSLSWNELTKLKPNLLD